MTDEITQRTQQILDEMQLRTIEINGSGMIPNSSQIPDMLFDQVEGLVTPEEWKVISYIARRTFGFKRRRDKIGRTQLSGGLVIDGERKDWGTGLSENAVRKALKFPIQIGLIVEHPGRYEPSFEIQTDHQKVDWAALARRRAEKEEKDRVRIAKARRRNPKVSPPVGQEPSTSPPAGQELSTSPPVGQKTSPPVGQGPALLSDRDALDTQYIDTQLIDTQEGAAGAAAPETGQAAPVVEEQTTAPVVSETDVYLPPADVQMGILTAGREAAVADSSKPEAVWLEMADLWSSVRGARIPNDKERQKYANALRSVAQKYQATPEVVRQAIERMAEDPKGEGWAFFSKAGPHAPPAAEALGDVIGKIQLGTPPPRLKGGSNRGQQTGRHDRRDPVATADYGARPKLE
jgi:hypothetical protein